MIRKRRSEEEHTPPQNNHPPLAAQYAASHTGGAGRKAPRNRFKKSRTPRISGQGLPVPRIVEVLSHEALQLLLHTIILQHPQVAPTIAEAAPKPLLTDAVHLMEQKAHHVRSNLPYKCDVESDYSYIRIKPHLTEFLACVLDFVLDLLPPMQLLLPHACRIMDVATGLIHELPNFSNKEFQYTKSMAYEQLANLWLILLTHHRTAGEPDAATDESSPVYVERRLQWAKTVEELELVALLEKHNASSQGKFAPVLEYLRTELAAAAPQALLSILCDLITVDYLNYSIAAHTSR